MTRKVISISEDNFSLLEILQIWIGSLDGKPVTKRFVVDEAIAHYHSVIHARKMEDQP